ncbi:MAG: Shedu anti-phage system protein SduA domain-containing protein [Candidatus Aenigmatarchaeota archaeon]
MIYYPEDKQKELLLKILAILLNKLEENHFKINEVISTQEILNELNKNKTFLDKLTESEISKILKELESEGVLSGGGFSGMLGFSTPIGYSFHSVVLGNNYMINYSRLKSKVDEIADKFRQPQLFRQPQFVEIKSKLEKRKEEIKLTLGELKKKISNKEKERIIHKYIKEKGLLPYLDYHNEFKAGSQNRLDFLILNEYGEYELWELKSPRAKLFSGKINTKNKYYDQLKSFVKTSTLTKAIEQILVYKKWLIDHCDDKKEHNLKNHIYNSKLVVIIGSDDELKNEIVQDKLNLERHAYHNLNIITYEMLYKKIENSFKELIGN